MRGGQQDGQTDRNEGRIPAYSVMLKAELVNMEGILSWKTDCAPIIVKPGSSENHQRTLNIALILVRSRIFAQS